MTFEELVSIIKQDDRSPLVIAVDGRAAAGKTTLADRLSKILSASVIHMDDFFSPKELRSSERLSQPGGNIHYERFSAEVLTHLESAEEFCYKRFDCSTMSLGGVVEVPKADIYVVEGSYSHHPNFGDYAHIKIFMDISPSLQLERIADRNGKAKAEVFKSRWIPMEEEYFSAYSIKDKSDIVINGVELWI